MQRRESMPFMLELLTNLKLRQRRINTSINKSTNQLHFVAYNFVVSSTSSSTKVRMTTDSSMRTETGLSLNDVSQPAPGNVPNMRGILLRSRCHPHFAVYDIQKFFRSVLTSIKDSFLRIVCVPSGFFSSTPTTNPTCRYFRDQAIPFGDRASGDYATCAKVATVKTFIEGCPPTSNLQSYKLYWKIHISMTEVWELTLRVFSLRCSMKLKESSTKEGSSLNPGRSLGRREPASTWA